jgi:hypothetical protein
MYKNLQAKLIILLVYCFLNVFAMVICISIIEKNKLFSLLILTIEHELLQEIDTEEVIESFANKKCSKKVFLLNSYIYIIHYSYYFLFFCHNFFFFCFTLKFKDYKTMQNNIIKLFYMIFDYGI